MKEEKTKVHVLMLSDEDKERLTKIANQCIDIIDTTNSVQEKAFILRVLLEGFEEAHNCVVPFKNRYTEPIWNYHEKGAE